MSFADTLGDFGDSLLGTAAQYISTRADLELQKAYTRPDATPTYYRPAEGAPLLQHGTDNNSQAASQVMPEISNKTLLIGGGVALIAMVALVVALK